jgi:hypothetical protein
MSESQNFRLNDRLTVNHDGEEKEVYNWVNIKQPAIVRGSNPVVERFNAEIGAGDSPMTPEAVTAWVAEELLFEFNIDLDTHDEIEVIDIESEEVVVL